MQMNVAMQQRIKRFHTLNKNGRCIRTQISDNPQSMPRINGAIGEDDICDLNPITSIVGVGAVDTMEDKLCVELGVVDILTLFDEKL